MNIAKKQADRVREKERNGEKTFCVCNVFMVWRVSRHSNLPLLDSLFEHPECEQFYFASKY